MTLDKLITPDLIEPIGQYVGVFLGSGLLLSVVAWGVGYVVTVIIDTVRGGV